MAQKVIDARHGQKLTGSDAWFWSAALEPEDTIRPYWETMPFLPRPAQVARVAAKEETTFADDPLDEERRDSEKLIQAAMFLFFAGQWVRLRRQLRANRKALEEARKIRRQIAITIGLDWGQEQGRLWAGLTPVLDGVIGTAKKSIWVQLADLGVELSWDIWDRAAEQWAMKYRYDLVTRINASTQTMLGRTISRWIASDQDFEELTEKVWRLVPTNPYPNLVDRPRVIAQTETTRVYAEARMAGLKAAGLQTFTWQTARDERVCKVCRPLHNQVGNLTTGILNPENGRYYKPPSHPACRCWLNANPAELEARTRPYPLPTMPGEVEKRYNPDQPRYPAGDERGGQWAPEGAGSSPAGSTGQAMTGPEVRAKLAEIKKRHADDLARLTAEKDRLVEEASQTFSKQLADGVAGTEESEQVIDGMRRRIEAMYRAENDLHSKFVDDQLSLLWAKTPGTVTPEFSDAITDRQREAITQGFAEFNRLVGSKAAGKVLILPGTTGRAAYFSADRLDQAEASIKGAFASSQIVHELGHHFEETATGALDEAVAFYRRRTINSSGAFLRNLRPDSGYADDEIAIPDSFYDPYVGKVYYGGKGTQITATEVVSMGIEAMRYIPAKFANDDPDHFDLIWKLMRS